MSAKKTKQNRTELPILQPTKIGLPSRPRKGRGRIRAFALILVHLVILGHITHFWLAGRTISPVEPSEARYTIELGQLNAGAIFFGLAILSTVIFGRFFCGWGCHIVALQDLCGHILRRMGFRPKPLRSRLLVLVPYAVAFEMFFHQTAKRLWMGVPHPGFSNHLMTTDFWYTFPGSTLSNLLTFAVCGGVIVYLLGNKGFCTYACPYGAFFSVADRLAVGRIRVTDACHQCGQCTAHCTSNVQVHAEVRDFGMVVDPGCMKCMDCVSVCPNEALFFGFASRPGSRDLSQALPVLSNPPNSSNKKTYDFSWPEELLGLFVACVAMYAVRELYDFTPLLLSAAVGAITAYLAIQFLRVFGRRDQRLQNFQLKRNGRFTLSGRLVVMALVAWFVFIVHSFFVQHYRYRGRAQLSRVLATWDELLSGTAQQRLTLQDHKNIDNALRSYRITDRIGILDTWEVKRQIGIGSLMKGELETAESYFRQAYACNPYATREMLQEFLVAQDRQAEAAEIR